MHDDGLAHARRDRVEVLIRQNASSLKGLKDTHSPATVQSGYLLIRVDPANITGRGKTPA